MDQKPCVILNPKSGHGSEGDRLSQTLEILDRRGVEVFQLNAPGELTGTVEKAVEQGYEPIIAAGGDGTICGVADALCGKGVRMGVLPHGTFNYFARSFNIPEDIEEALDVALHGKDAPLSVGDINGKTFLNNASIGAYAAVLAVREDIYKQWGRSRLAAYWSVLVAMATLYRSLKMKITVDGEVHNLRSPVAFAAIRAYQLDEFDLDGISAVKDGKMAMLVARDSGRMKLLWHAIRIFFRGARRGEDYILLTGREIDIETNATRRVARDGERENMKGPFKFRMHNDAITIRVPNETESTPG